MEEINILDVNCLVLEELNKDKFNRRLSIMEYLIHCFTCLYIILCGQNCLVGRISLVVAMCVDKCMLYVVLSVDDQNRESCRLLVKERIANIGQLKIYFSWTVSIKNLYFVVFLNQPTMHSGGVSRIRVCGC